jgi:hypothetical protein
MGDIAVVAAKVGLVDPGKAETFTGIAGVTITAGQFVYGIIASGKLGLADEDASAEASAALGVALNGGGAGQAIEVCRKGRVAGFTLSGHAYWLACSLSATAGAILDTGASTNIVARVEAMPDNDMTKVLMVDCGLGLPTVFA